LLHFGWDWGLKDGDLFLEVARRLSAREGAEQTVGLTVSDDPRAKQAVEQMGEGSTVRRVDPIDHVRTLYAAADLFVSTSRVEGQPFAVIEAILSGLPVVATDLPGHHDVCDQLASCRVVERSPDLLASAAAELLEPPPADAAAAAEAARGETASRFDLAPWTTRMFERYERALARRSGPGAP
jgi:glycosyltransferase involved in cell wall biosynthesis